MGNEKKDEEKSNMVDDENNVIYAPNDHNIKIIKWRVREGFPVNNSQVIFLYEECDTNNKEVKRFKSHNKTGVVKKRLYEDGAIIEKGSALLELCECVHTTVIKDMCADCGADLRQNENGYPEASVPMVHSVPDLKVTQKLAQQLGQADTKRLLEDRKLVLLVDLDQTLIHTTNDNVPNNIKGIYHFQLYGPHSPWYHTRLRPRTTEFLNNIAPYFELHICTFGARNYAHMIAQLLDPDGRFFSHRILSRDECFNVTYKTDNLKALFPCGDSMVCIIDDREDVWNMASNLIQVKPYHFFQHTGDINAPPGLSKHELDGKGVDFKELKISSNSEVSKNDNNEKVSNNKIDEETDKKDETKRNDQNDNEESKEKTKDEIEERKKMLMDSNEHNNKEEEELQNKDEDEKSKENSVQKIEDDTQNNSTMSENLEKGDNKFNQEPQIISKRDDEQSRQHSENQSEDKKDEKSNDRTESIHAIQENKNNDSNSNSNKPELKENECIEIEDPDDYLLYLESILKSIHKRFYEIYDEQKIIPDLKILVPQIRSKVLSGLNLVFSGLVPNQMKLEQSRAYLIARSLGANVAQHLNEETTHLVAVTVGTFKYNAARKSKEIFIVTPDWLWCCAERWERVDEKLFPLDPHKPSKMRQPPPHCHSPEHVANYNEISPSSSPPQIKTEPKFIDTINPLLSFSNDDLAEMNQEFDQFFETDSSSEDDEPINIEIPPMDKKLLKRKREENDDDRQRKFFSRSDDDDNSTLIVDNTQQEIEEKENESTDDDEPPSVKFRRGEKLPSDLEMGSEESDGSADALDEEDDGEWNMMGAALEREFLGLEK